MANTHIFMDLPDVSGAGESSAAGAQYKWIELESLSWGLKAKTDNKASGSQGQGQVKLDEVRISKHFDLATTRMMTRFQSQSRATKTAAFSSISILFADVVPSKDGENQLIPVTQYVLTDCYVSSLQLRCSSSGKSVAVEEEIGISFMKLDVTYYPPADQRATRAAAMTFSTQTAGEQA